MTKYLLKGGKIATCVQGSDGARVFKADLLIEGNTITRIEQNIAPQPGAEVINCTDKWITPGFVDTHRHVFMTVLRGDQADWLLSEYLVKMSWSVQADLTPEEVGIGTLAGLLDALHNGVTTVLDHFHCALTPAHAEEALKSTVESGARVIWAMARQSQPTEIFPEPVWDNEIETAKWQRDKLKEWGSANGGKLRPDGRVTLGLAYDIITQGPIEAHKEFIKYARSIPVANITAHVLRGPQILTWRDAGLLGPDVVFSHCNLLADKPELDGETWRALKDSGAAVSVTPEDELGMAHGNPVAFDTSRGGVKTGLGADCNSVSSGSLLTQMRVALQWARGHDHEHIRNNNLTPPFKNKYNSAEAFRLGTLGGAEALNLSHLIGTIEVGKRADLVLFDVNSVNLAGIEDPISGIVFFASSEDIDMVMVDGEIVKRGGKLVREWGRVGKELKKRAAEIRARWPADKLEERWKKWYDTYGAPAF